MSVITVFTIVLGSLSAWEEIQQLVQRGSWKKDMFYDFLFWNTDWKTIWKNFDSHHIAFGLFIAVLGLSFYYVSLNELWHVPLFWLWFFYVRNAFMHIFFRRKEYRQWEYLYKKFS